MRSRLRHRRCGRRRCHLHPRPDHHARRAELHVPLQVRAAMRMPPSRVLRCRQKRLL
jgi:hypothetical protein